MLLYQNSMCLIVKAPPPLLVSPLSDIRAERMKEKSRYCLTYEKSTEEIPNGHCKLLVFHKLDLQVL